MEAYSNFFLVIFTEQKKHIVQQIHSFQDLCLWPSLIPKYKFHSYLTRGGGNINFIITETHMQNLQRICCLAGSPLPSPERAEYSRYWLEVDGRHSTSTCVTLVRSF